MDYEGKTNKRKRVAIDDGTAGNSSSSSAAALRGKYEVFLSFRGIDTRDGFTDYLYNDLMAAGIETFRDDNELRVGEEFGPELLKAIKESVISIPIFSTNYASGKWCLRELAQMVECHKTMGQMIFPIFYDVEPRDVRYQEGSYMEAFHQHEKQCLEKKTEEEQRLASQIVQEWKEALSEVGKLKGWDIRKETNGLQGEFVKNVVVTKVLMELKKDYMAVTECLVGIDRHEEEMMKLLNVDPHGVRIVGIHGMGGIGKSTIAKIINNKLSEQFGFDCCCFLKDVRASDLLALQKQLISKVRKAKSNDICNVDEGKEAIKRAVCNKKVLIVLDDVDKKDQFSSLVGELVWFHSGSRIIITTRDRGILEALGVDGMYEPQPMEDVHALKLFSMHAFRNELAPEDYDNLSREIVSTTGGLPLALEVIGSSLAGNRKKEFWEVTLDELKNIPDPEVREKLKISYDALQPTQKQIFLDIACYFIGTDQTLPFYMWDACKFYPLKGIDVLVLRSLLKIGDDNKLMMHDQIIDLGRSIVDEDNSMERRSRLWRCQDALKVLEYGMGTKKIEALAVVHHYDPWKTCRRVQKHSFTNDEFTNLLKLRFIQLDDTTITGDFRRLLPNIRWFMWRGCSDNSKPINFPMQNLVILDLSQSAITDKWEVWSQIKMAERLKVLNLSCCRDLTSTLDFSTFASLEVLNLSQCTALVELDASIGKLINLKVLDIRRSGIRELPDAFGDLKKLEELHASYCVYFDGVIPSSIGDLSSLKIWDFEHTWISRLPTSICRLSCIQTLYIRVEYCVDLQSLPELPPNLTRLYYFGRREYSAAHSDSDSYCSIESTLLTNIVKLSKLELLLLNRIVIPTLPVEIGALSGLKELVVTECTNLQYIPGLPSSLFNLVLVKNESLKRLPDLSNLKSLSELCINGCSKLIAIEGLGNLESLTTLILSSCVGLAKLDGLERLVSLQELIISDCKSLVEINVSKREGFRRSFLYGMRRGLNS